MLLGVLVHVCYDEVEELRVVDGVGERWLAFVVVVDQFSATGDEADDQNVAVEVSHLTFIYFPFR